MTATSKSTSKLRQGAYKSDYSPGQHGYVPLEIGYARLETAKSSRGTCKHCDFMGTKIIQAGELKLCLYGDRYKNGSIYSMCAKCAKKWLTDTIRNMQEMVDFIDEEVANCSPLIGTSFGTAPWR